MKTKLFYGSIGLAGCLVLFLVFYWSLRLNAGLLVNAWNVLKSDPAVARLFT